MPSVRAPVYTGWLLRRFDFGGLLVAFGDLDHHAARAVKRWAYLGGRIELQLAVGAYDHDTLRSTSHSCEVITPPNGHWV